MKKLPHMLEITPILKLQAEELIPNSISGLPKQKQSEIIAESISKIKNDVGAEPKTFIPPGNKFNEDTVSVS